jgi:hypothetical protein
METKAYSPSRVSEAAAMLPRLVNLVEKAPIAGDSLSRGRAALSFLYFYYSCLEGNELYAKKGWMLLEEILQRIDEGTDQLDSFEFYRGSCGLMSVLNNLVENDLLLFDPDDLCPLDQQLFQWTMEEMNKGNFDFFAGATGSLTYFVDRYPEKTVIPYIDRIMAGLWSAMNARPGHFALINRFYNKADSRMSNEVNFGLAHGMSSVLLTLVTAYEKGYRSFEIDQIILRGTAFILTLTEKHKPLSPYSFIGTFDTDSGRTSIQRRLGWCFSDLNVLHLLYRVLAVFPNENWTLIADAAAAQVESRVSEEGTWLKDPFLCHGYAGVSQYYRVLHQLTGRPGFEKASEYWLGRTLDFFRSTPDDYFCSTEFSKRNGVHSFFYGLPGVILCLLTAVCPQTRTWSKIILL